MRLNILVTGHKGFIGSHVYSNLIRNGFTVYGLDRGDVLPENIKFDVIVHLAARSQVIESVQIPYEYFQDNLALTVRFLELARKHDATFVFASSAAIAKLSNPYALTKKHSMDWVDLYRKLYGIRAFNLILYNIYGEGNRKGAVYVFTKAALTGETATVYGDGTHVRDYFYVGDVVKVIRSIISGELPPGDYECGTGRGVSVIELIQIVERVTKRKINYVHKDYPVDEVEYSVAKNPVLKDPLPLEEGIKRVAEFIKSSENIRET